MRLARAAALLRATTPCAVKQPHIAAVLAYSAFSPLSSWILLASQRRIQRMVSASFRYGSLLFSLIVSFLCVRRC